MNHRVLKLTVGTENNILSSYGYCSNDNMLEPNDLTVSRSGTVFASEMRFTANSADTDGHVWSCLPNGLTKQLDTMGPTNGIELSRDERHLYVSESYNRNGMPFAQKIWRYNTNIEEGTISSKYLFIDFGSADNSAHHEIDGIRTDVNGNLFVARYGGDHIVVLSPEGSLLGKIALSFPNPTNLEFGGPHGRDLYIVGECAQVGRGCVDRIDVVNPGNAWNKLQSSNARRSLEIGSSLSIIL